MIEREMGNVLLSGKSFFKQREWNTNVSYRVEFLFTRFAHRSEQFNKKNCLDEDARGGWWKKAKRGEINYR
jgi:hypothetical protein